MWAVAAAASTVLVSAQAAASTKAGEDRGVAEQYLRELGSVESGKTPHRAASPSAEGGRTRAQDKTQDKKDKQASAGTAAARGALPAGADSPFEHVARQVRASLRRADQARAAGDSANGAYLDGLAREWAELGRDLERMAKAEARADDKLTRVAETKAAIRRQRAALDTLAAQREQARGEVERMRAASSAALPGPAVSAAINRASTGATQRKPGRAKSPEHAQNPQNPQNPQSTQSGTNGSPASSATPPAAYSDPSLQGPPRGRAKPAAGQPNTRPSGHRPSSNQQPGKEKR